MIARCRLFSHTCVVPSSSTLSSHCSLSLSFSFPSLFLRFTRSNTARGKRRIFEINALLIRHPSNVPAFFFFLLSSISIYTTYKRDRCFAFRRRDRSSPFHSVPRRTVLRDSFFIEVRGTVFEASVNRKRWLEEGRREIYGASNGVSLVQNVPSRDSTLFARKRFFASRRYSVYLRSPCTTNISISFLSQF